MGDPQGRVAGSVVRRVGIGAALVLAAGTLSACSSDGKPTLNWYINPDGQATLTSLAERCSTDDYDIAIQLLPTGATDQRTQLARRLAANDSSTDLMSLDPVFVAEFANAGWLAEFEGDAADAVVDDDVLSGPADTVQWDDKVYAAPQWANTQVLWYRQSLAEQAGIADALQDGTATWSQVIEAASENGATVGVQADRYEAYMVWINSLVQGAGGDIVSDTEAGVDAQVDIDSDAGRAAAAVVQQLADSPAAQSDLSVSREGTSLGAMYGDGPGEFMTNWTFVYKNYEGTVSEEEFADLAWARYPRTVEGEESAPPVGGIDIGVGAFSEHPDWALEAAQCVTDPEAQLQLAVNDGLMPARASVYEEQELVDAYDAGLLDLYRESIEAGGTRPKSAFYNQISGAVQSTWHPPASVDPEKTPRESAEFIRDVLQGKALL
ncbi:extracellular solute-binding protein [Nocardioides zeae]|uniref:Multiple sugar transport system substrate-binding protein n=1 Tax=Nocardioides zeae TaxID=1457234 RepID=A0AAJ1X3F1_9ACTN|nr:extracellular solute-binding protein [Nocardioides zeae]MDQ1104497.1 multiple sugar transport system substrate-binding protein [Nocardioides zeae]